MRVLIVCAALGAASCATTSLGTVEKGVAEVLISPADENKLGLQFKQELEQKQHVVYYNDPAVVNYVRGVADRVITFGKRDRPDVQWQVNVIDDSKTVNAFATPGGYLYVYSGLIMAADNEAELAGVMAHETGHVVARHSARQMVDAYGLQAVTELAFGKNPGLLGQIAGGVGQKGFMLANSRSDETEADEYGARYAAGAGYDPHGLVTFFQRLMQQTDDTTGIMAYLSDHPPTQDRINHVNGFIAQQHLAAVELGAAPYARIRQRLTILPVATGPVSPAPAAARSAAPPSAPPPAAAPPAAPPPGSRVH